MMVIAKYLVLATTLVTFTPVDRTSFVEATTVNDLNNDADQSLRHLYQTSTLAESLSRKARSVLVFPNVVKAGHVLGSAHGEGVLKRGSKVEGYYNCVTGPQGLTDGLQVDRPRPDAQSYGYVVFLMTPKAEIYAQDSTGWEIGIGPTVVTVDQEMAARVSASTLKDDAYVFIYGPQGLIAGISINGTRISKIRR